MLINKLDAAWRKRVPGGKRPKVQNIPFNGVMGKEIKAMGTKRIPVLSNRLFSTGFSSNMFDMSNMSTIINFESFNGTQSADAQYNPNYYKEDAFTQYEPDMNQTSSSTDSKMNRLKLQQELQDLKRQRLVDYRELQDLRERDLARKRIADQRRSYRAYGLDSSKEARGWLREIQTYKGALSDTQTMLGM